MIKKLILVVLIVLVIGFVNPVSAEKAEGFLGCEWASKYVFDGGIDFLPGHSINLFNFSISKGKTFGFSYVGLGKDYLEVGAFVEQTIGVKKVNFVTSLFPFAWKFKGEKADWGVVFGEKVVIQTFLNPTLGYIYLWAPNVSEWNGHYFFVEFSRTILTIDCGLRLGYNKEFCLEDIEGYSHKISLSRTISLNKALSVNLFFRYFWNDPKIDKNKPVFGASLNYQIF